MCTNQPILTPGRKACGCHWSTGDWASENCDGAHFPPSQKKSGWEGRKGNRLFVSPEQVALFLNFPVWRLDRWQGQGRLHRRQLPFWEPGLRNSACVVPVPGRHPAFRGRTAQAQAHAQAHAAGARLSWCGCCPAPPPPRSATRNPALRPAPPRDRGRRDPVLRPARAGASRDRAALRVRVSDRDPGAPRSLPERWGGRGAPGAGLSPRTLASCRLGLGRRQGPWSGRPSGCGVLPF